MKTLFSTSNRAKNFVFGVLFIMSLSQFDAMALAQDALSSAKQANNDFGDYQFIDDMAEFVNKSKPSKKGTKEIQINKLVVFDAEVKTLPEEQKSEYLYLAMSVAKINPVPEVDNSMFVQVAPDMVIPVYLENSVAKQIHDLYEKYGSEGFKGKKMRFAGIHIYNYSKGPAIIVESMAAAK